MKDDPLKICPKCGKELRRLINGGGAIIFKGNGFYVTDKNGRGGPGEAGGKKGDSSKPAEAAPCPGCSQADTCPKAANG